MMMMMMVVVMVMMVVMMMMVVVVVLVVVVVVLAIDTEENKVECDPENLTHLTIQLHSSYRDANESTLLFRP